MLTPYPSPLIKLPFYHGCHHYFQFSRAIISFRYQGWLVSTCSRRHRSIIVSSRLDCFHHIFPPRTRSTGVTRQACIHSYWQFEWCLAILISRLSLRWDVPTCVRNFDVLHKVKVNWLKLKSSKAKPIIKLPISIITIGIASKTRFVSCKKKTLRWNCHNSRGNCAPAFTNKFRKIAFGRPQQCGSVRSHFTFGHQQVNFLCGFHRGIYIFSMFATFFATWVCVHVASSARIFSIQIFHRLIMTFLFVQRAMQTFPSIRLFSSVSAQTKNEFNFCSESPLLRNRIEFKCVR